MDDFTFSLTQSNRKFLEEYCAVRSGSYFSKMIKALLLIDEKYPVNEIEKILSIKIGWTERFQQIYMHYGLSKLLEGDEINRYDIVFEVRKHGWIHLLVNFVGLTIKISLSSVFNPIPDLLGMLKDITENKESTIIIDEEGRHKKIVLTKLNIYNKKLYELKIIADGSPVNIYEFKIVIYRDVFLYKFCEAFKKMAVENLETKWVGDYNFSEYIQNNIKDIVLHI